MMVIDLRGGAMTVVDLIVVALVFFCAVFSGWWLVAGRRIK
jgi:hypothetical protein